MLPEMDGFELCRTIRRDSRHPHRDAHRARRRDGPHRGLEIGADDYIPKPFEPRELLTRIQTILRRARAPAPTPQSRLVFDGLEIDLERRQVLRQGEPVELTVVAGADPGAVVAMEVFVEQQIIPPVGVMLEFCGAAKHRPSSTLVA